MGDDEEEMTGPAIDTSRVERNLGKLWRAGKSPEAARRYLMEREGIDQPDELLANFWPAGEPDGPDFSDVRSGGSTAPVVPSGTPGGGYGTLARIGEGLTNPGRILSMFNSVNPFNDELAGAVTGLGRVAGNIVGRRPVTEGVADTYRQTRDEARGMVNAFHVAHPKEALAGDLVLGMATPSPFGKTKAVSTLGRIGAAAARGAGEGALFGFGNAEGTAVEQALQTGAGGILGGAVGGTVQGVASLFQRGAGSRAADLVAQAAKRDDRPVETVLQGVVVDPAATGAEAMGRPGRQLALRVARQGGEPADRLAASAQETLAADNAARQAIRTGQQEALGTVQQQYADRAASELGAVREAGQTATRTAKDLAVGGLRSAKEKATGDRLADAFITRAKLPPNLTLRRATARAEAELTQTGREMFGKLNQGAIGEGPEAAPVFDVLGSDPIVREAYEKYAPQVAHVPEFAHLQKAYQLLGVRIRQAAQNGGATAEGTLLTDLRASREALGQAMEQTIPGFAEANATYRIKAEALEALEEGYQAAKNGVPTDIADRLKGLNPDAATNYRFGLARGLADDLRSGSAAADAATTLTQRGSHAEGRIRLAFPDDASYAAFQQEAQQAAKGVESAKAEGRAMVRGAQREARQTVESTKRTIQNDRRADVLKVRRDAVAQREALPKEGPRLAAEIAEAARTAGAPDASGQMARAGLDVATGATGGGFAGRAVSALSRETRSIPLATRTELAKLLGSRGPALREAADATMRRVNGLKKSVDRSGRAGRSVRTIFNQNEDDE